jgi:uncharacterized membrane protein YjjB (DUF3815 family)
VKEAVLLPWFVALLIQLSFSYLATVAFAVIINVPRKALNLAGWAGMMGWLAYWLLMEAGIGRMMANLTGAFVIGVCGIFFARYKKNACHYLQHPGICPIGARCRCLSGGSRGGDGGNWIALYNMSVA